MTLSDTPGSLKRFRRTPWRFQQTFQTPLKNLRPFVSIILSAVRGLREGAVTIDEVVFEPKHVNSLLHVHSLSLRLPRDWTIAAAGRDEVAELLEATLSDWVDFTFVPAPKPFVIYADHDEYTTFYANTKSNLNRVVQPLSSAGFKEVPGYARRL